VTESVKELQINICDDNIIRVYQLPETGVKIGASLSLSSLQVRTIQVFTEMLRQNRLTSYDEFRALGENLYAVLFEDNSIGKVLNGFLQGSEAYSDFSFLRIKLEFEEKQQYLEHWPWEYLFCPSINTFLSERADVILTRYVPVEDIDGARSLFVKEAPPLIVLFVAASPDELGRVQYEYVLDTLKELEEHNAKRIRVDTLVTPAKQYDTRRNQDDYAPEATFERFITTLKDVQPHVLHFVGHGKHTNNGGQLAFVKLDFTEEWIDDHEFVSWFGQIRSLRLVFLQACESVSSDYSPYIISGVANYLARLNIPAVIAMKYEIDNDIANIFATAFYQALVEG